MQFPFPPKKHTQDNIQNQRKHTHTQANIVNEQYLNLPIIDNYSLIADLSWSILFIYSSIHLTNQNVHNELQTHQVPNCHLFPLPSPCSAQRAIVYCSITGAVCCEVLRAHLGRTKPLVCCYFAVSTIPNPPDTVMRIQ